MTDAERHNDAVASGAWPGGPMLAFDVETTGLDPESARIVAAAVVAVGGDTAPETTAWLLDPGIEIPLAPDPRPRHRGEPVTFDIRIICDDRDADAITRALAEAFRTGTARTYPTRDGMRTRLYFTADLKRPEDDQPNAC
ncbi:DNA polymerase III subunit epsilon [Streptomyces sp. YIM 121038]|uniref:hypothetical protein n=1 Tax=Streptomyces sp. YIM 121038 TaxID=2136401 RepID=UPI00116297BB|nr:hypothetical protein [Streptomyces sp. YIM 121038]QCX74930.1 DNA polymerase III subunit epsilon [Streptomyces sp. YIM 121038]